MFVNKRTKFKRKTEISFKQQKHYKSAFVMICNLLKIILENDVCHLDEKHIPYH